VYKTYVMGSLNVWGDVTKLGRALEQNIPAGVRSWGSGWKVMRDRWHMCRGLILSWPARDVFPLTKSFQVPCGNSFPLFLRAAIYLEVSLFRWTSQNAFSRETAVYIWCSIICTRLFRGKMHSDWFNGIEILQGRWQHGEKVGYCNPSGLETTLCKWDIYVPLVTKGLI
jgi:hypothetical protein